MSRTSSLSATNLATYHHFSCDLYIHNVYHDGKAVGSGVRASSEEPSELSKAQFQRGVDWEQTLLSWLDESGLLLTVPSTPMDPSYFIENLIMDDRPYFFVAGLVFWPPSQELNARYRSNGKTPVNFGLAKPDLLEVTKTPTGFIWRVVDAKASSHVKTSHHVQIYFYTLCLDYLLADSAFEPSKTAAVWLPPEDGFDIAPPSRSDIKDVDLTLLSSSLDTFLFYTLPSILSREKKDINWHFNPTCKGCPYTSVCSSRAVEEGALGSMSNVSIDEARSLRGLLSLYRDMKPRLEPPLSDIEDLAGLIQDRSAFAQLSKSHPMTMKKAKRVLSLPVKERKDMPISSPMIDAALQTTIQVKQRRNFTCPSSEDIAVMMSFVQDPSSPGVPITAFCISTFVPSNRTLFKQPHIFGPGSELVLKLAAVIRSILETASQLSVQFYVFSPADHTSLQKHLIDYALTSVESPDDVRLCIGALSDGATLLQTTFQPVLLSGALNTFLTKVHSKAELQSCLERMGQKTDGNVPELRARIKEQLEMYRSQQISADAAGTRRSEIGQLSRVVSVRREISRLLVLPIPGFWDLPECADTLVGIENAGGTCPSDEAIFDAWIQSLSSDGTNPFDLLRKRNRSMHAVLQYLRNGLHHADQAHLLVNEAKCLTWNFMDICRQDQLRKLFFMQQFEVLARLSELWNSRMDGCPDAPILQYKTTASDSSNGVDHIFSLIGGSLDTKVVDNDKSYYDYILVHDVDDDESTPIEALFDDLGVSGLFIPLNKNTKPRWTQQHPSVREGLLLADIRDIAPDPSLRIRVAIKTWGDADSPHLKLVPEQCYRISPRLVDFNTSKVLESLVEIDFRKDDIAAEDPEHGSLPFIQLLMDPKSLGRERDPETILDGQANKKVGIKTQSLMRELDNLTGKDSPLVLRQSQAKAAKRILSNRLAVVWGPPGTGKTHTIALSLLQLLDAQYRSNPTGSRIVFVTAMTHAAIEAIRNKLRSLIASYREVEGYPLEWLDCLKVEHVEAGNSHARPTSSPGSTVYAGTVFQLFNFSKKNRFQVDCVMIDEGGQVSLSTAALVLRSLSATGKIVVAGDSEQLAPILAAQYPKGHLFGSLLDCLMYWSARHASTEEYPPSPTLSQMSDDEYSQPTVVQLTENFRLNQDLGDFVSTIYSRAFEPQKWQIRSLATALRLIHNDLSENFGLNSHFIEPVQWFLLALANAMTRQPQTIITKPKIPPSERKIKDDLDTAFNPISLALVRLKTLTTSADGISYEAHVRAEAAVAVSFVVSLQRVFPNDDIFVAAPHRIQRQTVTAMLSKIETHIPVTKPDDDDLVEAFEQFHIGGGKRSTKRKGSRKIRVDTVERLQGSEARFVICLFSMPQCTLPELAFLLERRRLNVAISRAKDLCIMISSDEVLRPSVRVLANERSSKGYAFLRAYEDRAWTGSIEVPA